MNVKELGWMDYAVMVVVVIIIVGLFLKFALKKTTTFAEYIWGGHDLGIWTIAGSLIATNVSGMSFFIATEIYQFGVNIVFENFGILAMIFVIRIQAQVLCKLKLASLNEYMTLRYCKNVQILASLVSTFNIIRSLIITSYSPALFFTELTDVPLMTCALVIYVACYILSALSGFSGVVWTDTVQFVAIFFTLITLIIYGLIQVDSVWDIIPLAWEGGRFDVDWSSDPTKRLTFWSSFLGFGPHFISLMTLVSPAVYQRYCALPDENAINKVSIIHILGQIFSRLTSYSLGYIMYALYAKCDPLISGQVKKYDQVLPYFLQDISNGKSFIQGVFITGYASATFSTLTTLMNTLSIIIYKDFLEGKLNPTGKFIKAKRYVRLIGFLTALTCYFVLYFLQNVKASVIELANYGMFLSATYVTVIMTGIFLPRVNSKCVFWGASIVCIFAMINEIGRHSYSRFSPLKTMRTDGCTFNVTSKSSSLEPDSSDVFYLFKISPFYQFSMYCVVSTLVMVIASYFVGRTDYSGLDPNLISPLMRHYLPKTGEVSIPLKRDEDPVGTEMEMIPPGEQGEPIPKAQNSV